MLCKSPYRKGPQQFGCGQCMPCRANRKRLWTGRLLVELLEWHDKGSEAAFVTLTYNPEHLPQNGHLEKSDLQKFLKRVRKAIAPRTMRYFAVGEYGDQSWRPHYHLIMYGISPTESSMLQRVWAKGHVYLGSVEAKSIAYVCSYVTKNLTKPSDPRLGIRIPEFALMSLKPGLGYGIIDRLKKSYMTARGKSAFVKQGWIGECIRIHGRKYPLSGVS